MLLPVKKIPEGHSVLSQSVTFNSEETAWLSAKNVTCNIEIDRLGAQLHLHVTYQGTFDTECSRCLKPVSLPVEGDFRIVCVHRADVGKSDGLGEEDADFIFDDNTDEIDLSPSIYEEILISLPMKPLCSEDCPGILVADKPIVPSPVVPEGQKAPDPRWDALRKLKK
jgi:uncharacterized protein